MQKIIYALWRPRGITRAAFNAELLETIAARLMPQCHALRINLQDADSERSSAFRFTASRPAIEAVVQIWLDSALPPQRAAVDAIIADLTDHYAAWLVAESTPLPRDYAGWTSGQRSPVYTHLALISVPPRLSWAAWRDLWQNRHTQVAIETQSNNEYVQNLVVHPLTYGAPGVAAIIEESFPPEAAFDDALFHDAVGDPARHEANRARLSQSTASFVDMEAIDLIPMGQYDFKVLRGSAAG